VQAAEGARKAAGGGVAGAAAARAELVGEMPKAKFEAIKGVLTQDGVNELYDRLGKAGFSQWERISAEEALHRLLGLSPGGAPRPFEISLLKRAFGANMVEALSDRSLAKDIGHWLKVAVEMPRAIMTSHGFSVFFRQGFRAIGTPEYWTSIIPTIRAWGSEKFARSLDADIRSRPTYEVASKPVSQGGAGVHFNEMSEAGGEEGLASAQQLLERTPVAGKQFFARNGRAFVAGLNRMRIEMFDRVYKNVADSGRDVTDPKFLKALGELVNSQTGRGAMTKSAERASQLLAEWMFSPRLTVSRFDPFNPLYYGTKFNQGLMTETVRQNLSAAAAATAILGTFSAAGYKVGMDYRSADFGKARKGDTRVDPLGGHAQVIRLLGQIGSGQTVSSETGKVTNLRSGKFGAKTTLDVIGQFFANKEAPIPSLIVLGFRKLDNQLGPDGLPINMGKEALERMVPIPFGSVLQAAKEWHDDPAQLAQFGVLAQVGMGVETYKKELQGPAPIQFTKDGHTVRVSDRTMNAFLEDIKAADMHATARALALTATPSGKRNISDAGAEKLTKDLVKSERAKVLYRWNQANKDAQVKYDETGAGTVKYDRTPEEDLARRYKGNK
jgi:hypothetical protein